MRIYRAVVLAVLSSLLAAASAHAQQERRSDQGLFEFTALGGIQFGGSPDLVGFSGSLDSGPSFGGIAAVRVSDEGLVALSYTCQRTEFEVTSTGPVPARPKAAVPAARVAMVRHSGKALSQPVSVTATATSMSAASKSMAASGFSVTLAFLIR